MAEGPDHHERPVTPLGRNAQGLLLRRWPEFLIEFVLIIAGILAALAIDGWVQDRADRVSERAYLELLRDDLTLIEEQLEAYVEFESVNLEVGVAVYKAIEPENASTRDIRDLQSQFAGLSGRRTLQVTSTAYTDLQSTGNLQIIRDQDLRQKIIRYFTEAERIELIIEKNNTALVDGFYLSSLLELGITPGLFASHSPTTFEADALIRSMLGDDFTIPGDEVLLQPADAASWDDIRRMVILRCRVASVGAMIGRSAIKGSQEVRAAIEEALQNPI